jgi:hypothetical protein
MATGTQTVASEARKCIEMWASRAQGFDEQAKRASEQADLYEFPQDDKWDKAAIGEKLRSVAALYAECADHCRDEARDLLAQIGTR